MSLVTGVVFMFTHKTKKEEQLQACDNVVILINVIGQKSFR